MKIKDFNFPSSSNLCNISSRLYIPDGKIKYILQIVHGMQEYLGRYDDFARYLANKNILVVGCDLLGHGASIINDDYFGYFSHDNGDLHVLNDIHELTKIVKKDYPNIPYYIFGHSMGSFFVRRYLFTFDEELAGAIIMGTGHQNKVLVKVAKMLTKLIMIFKGEFYRSKLITKIAFGKYNERFEKRTYVDWLTKDQTIVDKYIKNKLCNYLFTTNGFYNLFNCVETLLNKNNLKKMNKELKILFVSGEEDPVGTYTKDVLKAIKSFKEVDMKNVTYKFYQGDRHEILNEFDKEIVYQDIYDFIQS